jgi:hypothetical protein
MKRLVIVLVRKICTFVRRKTETTLWPLRSMFGSRSIIQNLALERASGGR